MAQTRNQQFGQIGEAPKLQRPKAGADHVQGKGGLESRQANREIAEILTYFPYGPGFFGETLEYPKKKEGLFSRKGKVDMTELRREVNNFTNKQGLSKCRTEIKDKLVQQPWNAELHVLNAILVYNDAMQAGPTELNKLAIIKSALIELGKAMHNGPVSLFNTNWLIAIYTSYLGFLTDRLVRLKAPGMAGQDATQQKLQKELVAQVAMATNLRMITERQKGLKRLNEMLKKTGIFVKNLDTILVGKAAKIYLKGGPDKPVVEGESLKCGMVFQLLFTLANLYSYAPMLNKLVRQMLDMVPELHRDFILQKRMVIANQAQMEFYQAFAQDKPNVAKELADKLFSFHLDTIEQHLSESLLDRPFMIDPFIKYAWLIKDSSHLYRMDQNAKRAQKALPLLRTIQGERCQMKGVHQAASSLVYEMQRMLSQAGV